MSDYVTAMINWFGEKSFILAQSVSVASGGIWSTQVIYTGEFHEFIFKTTIVDKTVSENCKNNNNRVTSPPPLSPLSPNAVLLVGLRRFRNVAASQIQH